jgi:hypothetical protein
MLCCNPLASHIHLCCVLVLVLFSSLAALYPRDSIQCCWQLPCDPNAPLDDTRRHRRRKKLPMRDPSTTRDTTLQPATHATPDFPQCATLRPLATRRFNPRHTQRPTSRNAQPFDHSRHDASTRDTRNARLPAMRNPSDPSRHDASTRQLPATESTNDLAPCDTIDERPRSLRRNQRTHFAPCDGINERTSLPAAATRLRLTNLPPTLDATLETATLATRIDKPDGTDGTPRSLRPQLDTATSATNPQINRLATRRRNLRQTRFDDTYATLSRNRLQRNPLTQSTPTQRPTQLSDNAIIPLFPTTTQLRDPCDDNPTSLQLPVYVPSEVDCCSPLPVTPSLLVSTGAPNSNSLRLLVLCGLVKQA